jgi:hypothetical protein
VGGESPATESGRGFSDGSLGEVKAFPIQLYPIATLHSVSGSTRLRQQLRQLGDVGCDAPRLIAREQDGAADRRPRLLLALYRRPANYGNSLNDVKRTSLPQSCSVLAVDFSALLE